MSQADKIRSYILAHVETHPKDIVTVTANHFNVTRTTAHRHTRALLDQGKLHKTGTTRSTEYSLYSPFNKKLRFSLSKDLMESELWRKNFGELSKELPQNVYDICEYGFTEMVNNAIDHSAGTKLWLVTRKEADSFTMTVIDNGIGVFRRIKEAFKFSDLRESALHLSKGKLTTDPQNHSGEGIFFSSKVFDIFCLISNGLAYVCDNERDDWFLESKSQENEAGTSVQMKISMSSSRHLKEVFMEFSDPETFAFNKTHIVVKLSSSGEERFVSRSQAKRILMGIEKFNHIVLDFKDVSAVGQAFVDEIFRVYKNSRPDIQIEVVNASDDVQFMIDRGVATAGESAK